MAYFFLQYSGVFFGTVSFPEASLVQSDVTPNSGENWPHAHYSPALPEGFPLFLQRFIFFLTQCHGSPWRGRQCTRHLKRSSLPALLSVLGITLTKCTSLKYTTLPSQGLLTTWYLGHPYTSEEITTHTSLTPTIERRTIYAYTTSSHKWREVYIFL